MALIQLKFIHQIVVSFHANLSDDLLIRHQEHASQLGEQLFKRITLTAKLPFHFTVQTILRTAPVDQFMQADRVEISGIGKRCRSAR